MTTPQKSAAAKPAPSIQDAVRDELRSALRLIREADLPPKSLGYGDMQDGSNVGITRAVVAKVKLNATDTEYDVIHALGVKPVSCTMDSIESTGGLRVHAIAQPVRSSEWTERVARMDIHVLVGSLDGCIATFILKGA